MARAHAYEPHIGSPVEGYNGFGVNLQVPKKAELEALIQSPEHARGLDMLVGSRMEFFSLHVSMKIQNSR